MMELSELNNRLNVIKQKIDNLFVFDLESPIVKEVTNISVDTESLISSIRDRDLLTKQKLHNILTNNEFWFIYSTVERLAEKCDECDDERKIHTVSSQGYNTSHPCLKCSNYVPTPKVVSRKFWHTSLDLNRVAYFEYDWNGCTDMIEFEVKDVFDREPTADEMDRLYNTDICQKGDGKISVNEYPKTFFTKKEYADALLKFVEKKIMGVW
jgi:hypothetical protein